MTHALITILLTIFTAVLWIQAVQPQRQEAASQPTVNATPASSISGNNAAIGSASLRRNPDHAR